jgi:hypothetical protein
VLDFGDLDEDEDEDLVNYAATEPTGSKETDSRPRSIASFDIETEPEVDLAFSIHCFNMDLHRLRKFLQGRDRSGDSVVLLKSGI